VVDLFLFHKLKRGLNIEIDKIFKLDSFNFRILSGRLKSRAQTFIWRISVRFYLNKAFEKDFIREEVLEEYYRIESPHHRW
jgi:hypothetical protein